MNDMSSVIIPKSDQINADSLLAGPMTFTIKEVIISGGQEQPVSIVLEETPLFFRPCKSMSRVLVGAWGPDASKYVGKSLTLYRDPEVKWGGLAVGGIRISHMTDIDGPKQMMLTATKGSRKPFKVLPLVMQRASTKDYSATLAELKAIARPGNKDALGAKWQEIGAPARKALAAELPALKAACEEPAEDVPFDAPSTEGNAPVSGDTAQSSAAATSTESGETTSSSGQTATTTASPSKGTTMADQLGLDDHPGTAKADALVTLLGKATSEKEIAGLLEEAAGDIAAMLDEDSDRVTAAAAEARGKIGEVIGG